MTGRIVAAAGACLLLARAGAAAGPLVLVENGVSRAPVIVFAGAPPRTRRAADELAEYLERISGARPPVLEGRPDPLPERAIWVGWQPVLADLFPGLDFEFQHPEEILLAANGNHLVIAGRDRWDPERMTMVGRRERIIEGIQKEYGTANAVYTFLQERLGVRWLWPGELGIDVLEQVTITVPPFEYRYHPQIRGRQGIMTFSELRNEFDDRGHSKDWLRFQRALLDSLDVSVGAGHPLSDWWDRFHETNPEYFALQPDGSRGGGERPYPGAGTVKFCKSNPAFHARWLARVEEWLEDNPNQAVFSAATNDGALSGYCVCRDCLAWDHPAGELRRYTWKGLTQEYVTLSDRMVTLGNTLARLLRQRYPDRDYRVAIQAYGNHVPAPVAAVLDDNVIVWGVHSFFLDWDARDGRSPAGTLVRDHVANWARAGARQVWRPNTISHGGWYLGLPDVPLDEVLGTLRFIGENGVVGIFIDGQFEFWATQGPVNYLLGQLAWNPRADGAGLLEDYYRRGFGPAAAEIKAYWALLEETRNRQVRADERRYWEFYDEAFFAQAGGLLDSADRKVAGEAEKYRRRVGFVRHGLEYTRLVAGTSRLMARLRQSRGHDAEARQLILANWEGLKELAASSEYPHALARPIWIDPRQRFMGALDPDRL